MGYSSGQRAVAATAAAGVDVAAQKKHLQSYAEIVDRFDRTVDELDEVDNYQAGDPIKQSSYMKENVHPLMDQLREIVDELESRREAHWITAAVSTTLAAR